jgi:hypothetical protein
MVSYSDEQRAAILREARFNLRGRHASCPSADADSWDRLPAAQPVAAAPIAAVVSDQVAAAVPSGWSEARLRERAELEVAELERRAADAERRQIERGKKDVDRSTSFRALLDQVAELGAAANAAVTALLDRVETQAAEIEALRTRCAVLEGRLSDRNARGRKNTGSKKAPETLPNFLTPPLSS